MRLQIYDYIVSILWLKSTLLLYDNDKIKISQ